MLSPLHVFADAKDVVFSFCLDLEMFWSWIAHHNDVQLSEDLTEFWNEVTAALIKGLHSVR